MRKVLIVNYFTGPGYNSTNKIIQFCDNILKYYLMDCIREYAIYTDNENIEQLRNRYPITFHYVNPKYTQDKYFNLHIKYHYMFDAYIKHKNFGCDYIAFIQSNFRCVRILNLEEFINSKYKMFLLQHRKWVENISEDHKKHVFKRFYAFNHSKKISADSTISIRNKYPRSPIVYYQAGHAIIDPDFFLYFFNTINNMMLYDMYKNNYIPWHDETYMNFMLNFVIPDKSIINCKSYDENGNLSGFYFIDKEKDEWKNL